MTPGQRASFVKAQLAEDQRYWFAEVNDSHHNAARGVCAPEHRKLDEAEKGMSR
jgi:hypothetical protein